MRTILTRYPSKSIVIGAETNNSHSLMTEILIGFLTSAAATMFLYYGGFFKGKE